MRLISFFGYCWPTYLLDKFLSNTNFCNRRQLILVTKKMHQHFSSVRPFASEEEFQSTEETVRKFQGGVGKELHQKLLQRAKSRRNWVCIVCSNQCFLHSHGCFDRLTTLCFYPPVGGLVVGLCLPGGSHSLSALCEFCWSGTLPGTFLAPCWGDRTREGQYRHLAHAAVLEYDPHVSPAHYWTTCLKLRIKQLTSSAFLLFSLLLKREYAPSEGWRHAARHAPVQNAVQHLQSTWSHKGQDP